MAPEKRAHRGFTLVELLVAISVVVLLLAILLPALARARERARTTVCASAMRNIGRLIMTFASEHDGRGPGRDAGESDYLDWSDSLNWDTMGQFLNDDLPNSDPLPAITLYGRREQLYLSGNPNQDFPRGMLICPNFDPKSNYFGSIAFPYAYNFDAAGGRGLGTDGSHPPDQYGKPAPPGSGPGPSFYPYTYGANLGRFRPDQFLVVETEYGPETLPYPYLAGTKHGIPLNDWPLWPSYAGLAGDFSFRHPYSKMANFLYFDGHVGTLTPKDDINDVRMLSMPGSYPGT